MILRKTSIEVEVLHAWIRSQFRVENYLDHPGQSPTWIEMLTDGLIRRCSR